MCKSQPDNQLIGRPTTEEEVNHIVKTENFLKFFSSATKLVEVAITEETTLGLDSYSDDLMTEDANELVSVQRLFHDASPQNHHYPNTNQILCECVRIQYS